MSKELLASWAGPPKEKTIPRFEPKGRNGRAIIYGRAHNMCCIQFCKRASLLKPGRTPTSAEPFTRFCLRHMPETVARETAKFAALKDVARARCAEVSKERQAILAEMKSVRKFAGEPETLGQMSPSEDRSRSGWGLVERKGAPLHYFKRSSRYSACGRFFAKNQPVTPNYGEQCNVCLAAVVFSKEALR